MAMNNCVFTGNLGSDSEVKKVGENNTTLLSFSIAVNDRRNDNVMWVRCNIWGKLAESKVGEYLKKGTPVCVAGELRVRDYEQNDGTPAYSIDLNVNSLELVGSKTNTRDDSSPLD